MIWSQVFPYIAKQVYLLQDYSPSSSRLSRGEIQSTLIALTLVWAISAASLAISIKPNYWRTFYSTDTGSQHAVALFRRSSTDEARFDTVFSNHRSFTASIEAEIKQWLQERYAIWQLERPAWFNEAAIASIHDDMMPKEVMRELFAKGGGMRRRSSVGEKLSAGNKLVLQ